MEIIYFVLLTTIFQIDSYRLSKSNEVSANIRHARKKDQANRDYLYGGRTSTDSYSYDYDDYRRIWSTDDTSSTDSTSIYETDDEELWTAETTTTDGEPSFADFDRITTDEDDAFDKTVDVVTKFLRIVESQHELGENCTAGTDLNLGEGVVDRYAQERFHIEAEVAVNRANMLTRLWKYAGREINSSEYILHASVISIVEFNENIFAAGNCYDKYQYKDYLQFCAYAYRLPHARILTKNLGIEYDYLGNTSEWFFQARKNAEKVIKKKTFSYGYNTYTISTSNETRHSQREEEVILSVGYEDGRWSKPYYDCGGGNIWMLTYTVPFFGFKDGTYFFKGTSGIDIDLRRVDIDQCPLPKGEKSLNIFAASDKCKKNTTHCVSIKGLGFRRGSYKCVCKKGYYFPNGSATGQDFFDGTTIEEEYEKLMLGEINIYNEIRSFECLPCAEGCDTCVNLKPCVLALNWIVRTAILSLACVIILCLLIVEFFTWKYRHIKVLRAASPCLLRIIAIGALLIYCTTIVMYPTPTVITCTIRIWLREIGFSLTYGALMLKTWRISLIFRIRSARAVKITDMDLMKKLSVIVLVFASFLVTRTLVSPPKVNVVRTTDDLKAYLCETNWWDHWFSIMEALFLVWGIRLCIIVRKAPSQFNESRFISMAIYNEFLLSIFLNISMFFLYSPANPDLLYVICFCHTQMTITLLLCFVFGNKAYIVLRGQGKSSSPSNTANKIAPSKFILKSAIPTSSQTYPSSSSINNIYSGNEKLTQQDIQDGIHNICRQLETLKQKNTKHGAVKISRKLNSIYEFTLRTMEDISIEDESTSSYMIQESKIVEESAAAVKSNDFVRNSNKSTTNLIANNAICDTVESNIDQNVCSTCTKNNNDKTKVKSTNDRSSSWFKKCFSSEADTISNNSTTNNIMGNDYDIELAQTHSIILNADEERHCKKVSL